MGKKKRKKCGHYSGIGGQAVLEGVMMKNKEEYAVSVRKPDGLIETKKDRYEGVWGDHKLAQLPFLRGIFIALPFGISLLFRSYVRNQSLLAILEGAVRLAIFLIYVASIASMKDIRRVYQYHGAEHKCINCLERGRPLTVRNVMRSSRLHKRCGTSFLLFVMLISILLFMFVRVESPVLRLVVRILLIPVIAGISYEVIRLAGRSDNALVNLISKPGMWLQRLTTKEPDEEMVEVAIASVEAVFDWKGYLEEEFGRRVEEPEGEPAVQ